MIFLSPLRDEEHKEIRISDSLPNGLKSPIFITAGL